MACPQATNKDSSGDGGTYYDFRLLVAGTDGAHAHRVWSDSPNRYEASQRFDRLSGAPEWNPKGTQIAIVVPDTHLPSSHGNLGYGIWVINADGGHAHEVTDGHGHPVVASRDAVVTWSPDGKTLAYGSADSTLMTVAAKGGHPDPLGHVPSSNFQSLSWSPAGNVILADVMTYDRQQPIESTTLDLYPAQGGPPRPISLSPFTPSAAYYAPDGKHIAVSINNVLLAHPRPLVPAGLPTNVPPTPTPGPSGTILVASSDGSDPTPLPAQSQVIFDDHVTGWVLKPATSQQTGPPPPPAPTTSAPPATMQPHPPGPVPLPSA